MLTADYRIPKPFKLRISFLDLKKYPLPSREGIKGREIYSEFTPTLPLPGQRGR